jgi:signal transduction histidine kinase
MKLRLRSKIMTFTVLPLVTLAIATLWIVNWSITRHVQQGIQDDLRRASAVLENVLAARAQSLAIGGQMTVKDPKFFSVLTIPGSHQDPQLRATVSGVARDFNAITQADLFEVTDARGEMLAAVGRDASVGGGRDALVREALSGRPVSGILAEPDAHYQVSVAPVYAGGRPVGALLLGARIGPDLAERLRQLTRSEVTFVSRRAITGSTLESGEARDGLLAAVAGLDRGSHSLARTGTLLELRGGGHEHLTLVRSLPRSDPRQGQFYVMQRAVDAETAFLREIQAVLVGLGVTAVLVALLAGLVIAERITAPVQRLVRGAEEMERGNYDFPLDVQSRDEIGVLAARFDDMRRRQRDYVHSLREVARVKSEFISVASHELRTPISVIRGFHELMLAGKLGGITPQQRQALEATERSVATLTRIAQDATQISEIDGNELAIQRSDCDVAGLVDQAVAEVRGRAVGRRVALAWTTSPGLGVAQVDGPSLTKALVHLVSNAVRFTPDGGRVEVRASRIRERLVFSVSDTGVGIEPEHQRRLAEEAFAVGDSLQHHSSSTLEFNSAGLGLGIPIARGIAEAHGGRLLIESRIGIGTTVTLWIPAEAGAQLEEEAA